MPSHRIEPDSPKFVWGIIFLLFACAVVTSAQALPKSLEMFQISCVLALISGAAFVRALRKK